MRGTETPQEAETNRPGNGRLRHQGPNAAMRVSEAGLSVRATTTRAERVDRGRILTARQSVTPEQNGARRPALSRPEPRSQWDPASCALCSDKSCAARTLLQSMRTASRTTCVQQNRAPPTNECSLPLPILHSAHSAIDSLCAASSRRAKAIHVARASQFRCSEPRLFEGLSSRCEKLI
ncbi:hypothetical protein MTO96_002591 [Rhipicephalus appendiculatus]